MPFYAVWPKWFNVLAQKIVYAYFGRQEKCLNVVQNASFLLFLHFKMVAYEGSYEGSSEKSYSYVFHMLYRVPIFLNNCKAKLVVTVLIFLFTVKYKASIGLCVEK